MRIVFFGSSHGLPEPNRRCSCTMIELGERRYFIDMGTQAIEQLRTRQIWPAEVKAMFFTHMHGDHSNGLVSFVDLCSWYYSDADPDIFLPEPVEPTVEALRAWLKCNSVNLRPFRFHPVKEGVLYEDEVLKVTAFRTQHNQMSHAYLVEAEGRRVLFTGDLCHKGPAEDFPVSVLEKPLDLAVCEVAHFSAVQYVPLFRDQPNLKAVCFNHYSNTFLASIFDFRKELPDLPVTLAADGMEFLL